MLIETCEDYTPPQLKVNGTEVKPKYDYIPGHGWCWIYSYTFG